jgi:hypothetical protein
LLFNLHLPSDPSLNDNDTGTFGSLTIVPQDVSAKIESNINITFFHILIFSYFSL